MKTKVQGIEGKILKANPSGRKNAFRSTEISRILKKDSLKKGIEKFNLGTIQSRRDSRTA